MIELFIFGKYYASVDLQLSEIFGIATSSPNVNLNIYKTHTLETVFKHVMFINGYSYSHEWIIENRGYDTK